VTVGFKASLALGAEIGVNLQATIGKTHADTTVVNANDILHRSLNNGG
jgi:hypothetical protein